MRQNKSQELVAASNSGEVAVQSVGPYISKRRRIQLPQWATAWLVLIPALICIVFFMLYPILNTFIYAFVQDFRTVNGAGPFAIGQFIAAVAKGQGTSFGFKNFVEVLSDSLFLHSILNTAILVIVEVPLTIIISLLIATFLNSIKALKGLYQTIFFLPYVTNAIALGLVFSIVFSKTQGGLANVVLKNLFGIDPINWLDKTGISGQGGATRFTQGVVIVVYSLWNGIAFKILVFMSGLATIDKQYYDAAKIDGSSNFTIWRRITLPLLSPQILYITITSFIGSFKMYTGVMAVYQATEGNGTWFGGDTGDEWIPIVGWIYRQIEGEGVLTPGLASAGSLVLLGIIMVITVLQFAASKKRVHY